MQIEQHMTGTTEPCGPRDPVPCLCLYPHTERCTSL